MSERTIERINAREVLSTGSFPTVEADVVLGGGISGSASVPRGSSAGTHEPAFLLDGDPNRYHGLGVLKAVELVKTTIADALRGSDVTDHEKIDTVLRELDGTENMQRLGVNSILAVSLACVRAAGAAAGMPVYEYLLRYFDAGEVTKFPKPMAVVIEGGQHADNSTDFQEYMVLGLNDDPREAIRNCVEVYQELRRVLKQAGHTVNVGYEGAYAFTEATSNAEPVVFIEEAVKRSNLNIGADVSLCLDVAASEFEAEGAYKVALENRVLQPGQMISLYEGLLADHPSITTLEDPLAEDDWENWQKLCGRLREKALIIGDDLTVSAASRVKRAVESGSITGLIIKPNQAGTFTQTVEAIKEAKRGGCEIIVSHRGGGETNDNFITDLAIACGALAIKCGVSRGERVSKYNYMMAVADKVLG